MVFKLDDLRKYKPVKDTYFVFGCPISHSLSPQLHTDFFKKSGIDANYFAVEVTKQQLSEAVSIVKGYTKGVNLTIPLKECVIELLDDIDSSAKKIGAVNTLKFENGKITGFNTDYYGILKSVDIKDKNILILGNGGAARAFLHASLDFGKNVTVCGRDINKLSAFCKGTRAVPQTFDNIEIEEGTVIFNATPVGMGGLISQIPITTGVIKKASVIFDSIYNPKKTNLLVLAEIYNKKTVNGLPMLINQGIKAEEIWGNSGSCEIYEFQDEKREENVILTGFMGSGKSMAGKMLSEKLNKPFFDMDFLIEDICNMKITDIFIKYGEQYFRKTESEICEKISQLNGCIIATGGGVVKNKKNIDLLKTNGKVYFLNPDLEEIEKRLARASDRPLIQDKSNIRKLYYERINIYTKTADNIISQNSSEEAVNQIIRSFAER